MRALKISKNLPQNNFSSLAQYFGIAIAFEDAAPVIGYADIERFFLLATLNLKNSRVAEGTLCWLSEYGHLLSPSKIRKFIKEGEPFDPAVLGGFLEFMQAREVKGRPFGILKKYAKKRSGPESLFDGPRVRGPGPYFAKYNLLVPNFALDKTKFLKSRSFVMKSCVELRNRSLFGSVLNADVASALMKDSSLNAYVLSRLTGHHKTNVFRNFRDIKEAMI